MLVLRPRGPVRRGSRAPALLLAQMLFNVGFYAVVPFIAVVLRNDFGLAGAAIGLVLGVRTFAQQGLFVIGGALVDRFGAKTIILVGMATRAAGFALLAGSLLPQQPWFGLFLAGTVLTGAGGALFSPGLSALIAAAEARREPARVTLFAWLSVTGEIGAVLGPLVGALLLDFGFGVVAATGAAYFAAIGVLLGCLLTGSRSAGAGAGAEGARAASQLRGVLRDRRFTRFAALHSVDLLAYNQLYLAVPIVLEASDAPARAVAAVFAWVSALTLAAQLPLARWSSRVGAPVALRVAYLSHVLGFGLIAAAAASADSARIPLALAAASCFAAGHLVANPTALQLVPRFAGLDRVGGYFGLLATLGGIAVLLGNLFVGRLLDAAPPEWAVLPWSLLGVAPLLAAIAIPRALRGSPADGGGRGAGV